MDTYGYKHGSALQAACSYPFDDNREIVKFLIEKGANVDAEGGNAGCALNAACMRMPWFGSNAIGMLVASKVKVNGHGEGSMTPLHYASRNGCIEVAEYLLRIGANLEAELDEWGTPLQVACFYDKDEIIKLLVEQGANVKASGGSYGTALQQVCRFSSGGRTELVKILIEAGADVNASSRQTW